jgi:DNA-binding MarR family transcriptional regulator
MATTTDGRAGRFAFAGLDRALHERARLGVMVALADAKDGRRFVELKAACALTDGNLSRHLDVLEAAGLVEIWKGYDGQRPQTICRLTPGGRRRFRAYLRLLQGIVEGALTATAGRSGRRSPPAGFTRA